MEKIETDKEIYIEGLGIVFHSGGVISEIEEGTNYLETEYWEPSDVARHIKKGDMVGFCTGSPGNYILKFRSGYPDEQINKEYPIGIRLGIVIDDNTLYIRDLYELFEWNSECDDDMKVVLENGAYHITLQTQIPQSGVYGDDQEIYVFLQKLDEMPLLNWQGVPQLL